MPRRGKRKHKTRTTPRRPTRAPEPLTDAQDRRLSLLRRNAIEQQHVADHVTTMRGVKVSRQAVGAVIYNKFVNDDIIDAFCELTHTTRDESWPDVPPLAPGTPRRTGTEG